jgi:hypothetical protein
LSFSAVSTAGNWPDRSTSSSGVAGWARSTDADRSPDQPSCQELAEPARRLLVLSLSPAHRHGSVISGGLARRPPRRSSRSCSPAARRWPFTLRILHFRTLPAGTNTSSPTPQGISHLLRTLSI